MLVPAYDDAAGVTAAFNLNLLDVLNQRLDADFDRTAFEHVAVWDADNEWIEMRLRASRDLVTEVPGVGLTVHLDRGEIDPHRDLGQVPPVRPDRRTGGRRLRRARLVDRRAGVVLAVAVGSRR